MVCQKLDRVLVFFLFRLNPVFFFFPNSISVCMYTQHNSFTKDLSGFPY